MESNDLVFYTQTAFFVFIVVLVVFSALILVFRVMSDDKKKEEDYQKLKPALNRNLADDYLKLKEERRRFFAIIDTVLDGIITLDDKGEIQTFNKAAESMFGYNLEEVVDKRINLLIPPSELGLHEGPLTRHVEIADMDMIDIEREIVVYNKAGQAFSVIARVNMSVLGSKPFFICTIKKTQDKS